MPVATDLDFSVVQSMHGNAGAGTGVSRNRTAKQVTEVGSIGLGLGVQATSIATGSSVIAVELLSLSPDELEWIKAQDSDVVGTLLAAKMKSK